MRDLLQKLDKLTVGQLNEAPGDEGPQHNEPPLKIGDIDPRNGKKILSALVDGSGNVVRSRFGDIWNVKYGEPDAPALAPAPVTAPVTEPVQVNPVQGPGEITTTDLGPAPAEGPKCDVETLAKIKYMPSFNKAFAAAKAAGCETFQWCGVYTTPAGQGALPDVNAVTGNPNIHAQMARRYANQIKNKYGGKPTPEQIEAELKALHAPNGPLYNQNPQANAAVDKAIKNIIATGNNPYNAQTGMIQR